MKEFERVSAGRSSGNSRVEAILDGLACGLAILDSSMSIVFANKAQRTCFPGRPLEGEKCFKAFFRREDRCCDCPAVKTKGAGRALQCAVGVDDGTRIGYVCELMTFPNLGPAAGKTGMVVTVKDCPSGEKKESESGVRQTEGSTPDSDPGRIAHELNNSLNSIAGFSEGLLKRLKTNPECLEDRMLGSFREYLQIIFDEAYRCKGIIRELTRAGR